MALCTSFIINTVLFISILYWNRVFSALYTVLLLKWFLYSKSEQKSVCMDVKGTVRITELHSNRRNNFEIFKSNNFF